MIEFFLDLFSTEGYNREGVCGGMSPELIFFHNVADIAIWLAYVAIPIVIFVIWQRQEKIRFTPLVWLWMGFIFLCGGTHLTGALTFYYPAYRLDGLVKILCAVVSWMTVVRMVPELPIIINYHRYKEEIADLKSEIVRLKEAAPKDGP